MQNVLFSVFLLFSYSSVNAASNIDYQAMYDKCLKAAGPINNNAVLSCSYQTSIAVKKEINTLYSQLHAKMMSMSVDDAAKFEQSHKAWVSYRNKHCELATNYVGTPMYEFCPMNLNISRVSELRELAGE